MKRAHQTLFFEHGPWNRPWFWCILAAVGMAGHFFIGTVILFPVLAVPPVMLAAWHAGVRVSILLSLVLALVRWVFYFIWMPPWSVTHDTVNTVVRFLVLVLFALLTAHVARLHGALRERVSTLERLLPICSFCKRIRDERGEWKPVESYIASHSDTQFSHGFCPECARAHYPDIFPPRSA